MEWQIANDRPIWIQLYEQLILRIITGVYPKGSRMPAVRELAEEAGVNPNTMQRALVHLEEHGLAVANRTSGRTVTENQEKLDIIRMELARQQIETYLHAMKTLGFSVMQAKDLLEKEDVLWNKT